MFSSQLHPRSRSRSPLHLHPCSNSNSNHNDDRRIYVTDLSPNCRRDEIEKAFEKWPLAEIWHATASCFAFVVCQRREDVQQAIDELDGQIIGNARVRVSLAHPRIRRSTMKRSRKHIDSHRSRRCYRCGNRGHLSQDCENHRKRSNYEFRSQRNERD